MQSIAKDKRRIIIVMSEQMIRRIEREAKRQEESRSAMIRRFVLEGLEAAERGDEPEVVG